MQQFPDILNKMNGDRPTTDPEDEFLADIVRVCELTLKRALSEAEVRVIRIGFNAGRIYTAAEVNERLDTILGEKGEEGR